MKIKVEQRSGLTESSLEPRHRRDRVQATVQVGEDLGVPSDGRRAEGLLHLGTLELLQHEVRAAHVVELRHRIPVRRGVAQEVGLLRRGPAVLVAAEHAPVAEIEDIGVPSRRDEPHEGQLDVLRPVGCRIGHGVVL